MKQKKEFELNQIPFFVKHKIPILGKGKPFSYADLQFPTRIDSFSFAFTSYF